MLASNGLELRSGRMTAGRLRNDVARSECWEQPQRAAFMSEATRISSDKSVHAGEKHFASGTGGDRDEMLLKSGITYARLRRVATD